MTDRIDCTWEDMLPDGKLPGDVMVSILTNLPVKSLLRFKSVCKNWRCLISSPNFIKLHLNRQSVIANILLLSWTDIEYVEDREYDEDEYTAKTEFALLSHSYDMSEILPPWSNIEEGVNVVDTCKGLMCISYLRGFVTKHILWNPATRRYRSLELPKKPSCWSITIRGLGYVEATNDYKIVVTTYPRPAFDPCMFVYTLSSNSWKELDYDFKKFPINGYPVPPTFINGCLHWLGNTCICRSICTCTSVVNMICAFDVEDEVMRCFGVPDNYDPHPNLTMHILAIKGCLSVVIIPKYEVLESGIEIWMMVEYGVQGSWAKQFTIQGLTRGFTRVKKPLRSWKDSEILFMEKDLVKKLMFYEPSSKKKTPFEHFSFARTEECRVFNYVESLASVD